MIKRIFLVTFIILSLGVIGFLANDYFNAINNNYLRYDLGSVYLYHTIAAVITYVLIELIAEKLPNSAGYAYLASMCVKIGFFVLIFQSSVFSISQLTTSEKMGLIVPLFLFLTLEASAIFKLLNNKSF